MTPAEQSQTQRTLQVENYNRSQLNKMARFWSRDQRQVDNKKDTSFNQVSRSYNFGKAKASAVSGRSQEQ